MSRPEQPSSIPATLDAAIDRLVANELDDAGRRALLLELEATPDAWRRCALAFLEDQAWQAALERPKASAAPSTHSGGLIRPATPLLKRTRRARYVLAASLFAASVSLSFRLGVESLAPNESRVSVAPVVVANPEPVEALPPGAAIGWLSVADPQDGEAPPHQVPILAATQSNEDWLQEQPPTISDYVKSQWERQGFQVEEHRHLVGLDLTDGRHVAIPVDDVAVNYVGRQPL